MRTAVLVFLIVASLSLPSFGAVTVTPSVPHVGDVIALRVSNTFGASAVVTSASISQVGNTFTIQQAVDIACFAPANTLVTSEFIVGPLPPGSYTVSANIVFNGLLCISPAPITQTATFAVAPSIPALDTRSLIALAAALAVMGFVLLKR